MTNLTPEQRSEITLRNIGGSDCGIIAVMALTELSRTKSERLCKDKGDWVEGEGISRIGLKLALCHAGYTCTLTPCEGDTAATFSLTHEYGKYLIFTEGHVAALVEGNLYNSRLGSHSPVEEVYRVDGR